MELLALMQLSDGKARDKLAPLLAAASVAGVTLVRSRRVPLEDERLRQIVPERPLAGPLARGWFVLRRSLAEARARRPAAVLGFYLLPWGVLAWLAARSAGSRAVVSLTGTDFNRDLKRPLLGPPLRRLLRSVDAVAVFGEDARQALLALGVRDERVWVLPNTVDTGRFRPRPGTAPDADLVYVGYLRAPKRVDLLLQVLALLRRARPGARLSIVGDGPERARLVDLAQRLGIAAAVRFAGFQDDVADELARARVFVSLTEMEGLPAALLEALCCGLPAVVSGVGAVASVLRSGENGWCVDSPADPETVARLLGRLLSDEALYARMSAAARATAESHGWAAGARVWERLLRVATGQA